MGQSWAPVGLELSLKSDGIKSFSGGLAHDLDWGVLILFMQFSTPTRCHCGQNFCQLNCTLTQFLILLTFRCPKKKKKRDFLYKEYIIEPNQFQYGSTHLCTSNHSPEIPIRPKFLLLEQLLLQIVTQTHVRQDQFMQWQLTCHY